MPNFCSSEGWLRPLGHICSRGSWQPAGEWRVLRAPVKRVSEKLPSRGTLLVFMFPFRSRIRTTCDRRPGDMMGRAGAH